MQLLYFLYTNPHTPFCAKHTERHSEQSEESVFSTTSILRIKLRLLTPLGMTHTTEPSQINDTKKGPPYFRESFVQTGKRKLKSIT